MKKVFNPGYIVFEIDYDQGSSGGAIIEKTADPDSIYYDENSERYYIYLIDGWYWYMEPNYEYVKFDGTPDVSGMVEIKT